MAVTIEQSANSTNTLAQTFNTVFSSGPTEGNLLVALLWHDELSTDVEDLTSSGWERQATSVFDLGGFDYRASIWAKFAGAGESSTVAWDLGEVNRRAHGWAVEISSAPFSELEAEDTADSVDAETDPAGTSNQVDSAIAFIQGQLAFAICGTTNTSATEPNWAADPAVTDIGTGLSSNFRATGIGFAEDPGSIQPTATWGTSRQATQIVAVIGIPPPASLALKGSNFHVTPASA